MCLGLRRGCEEDDVQVGESKVGVRRGVNNKAVWSLEGDLASEGGVCQGAVQRRVNLGSSTILFSG